MSVPIWFNLISTALATPGSMPRSIRPTLVTNRSSPTSCTRSPERVGERLPAVPVLLGHPVLDGHDRVPVDQFHPVGRQLAGAEGAALAGQHVVAVPPQLAGGGVEGDGDLLAGLAAGLFDRLEQEADRVLVGGQVRREATLVAHRGGQALLREDALQRVVGLGGPAQALANEAAPTGMTMNS